MNQLIVTNDLEKTLQKFKNIKNNIIFDVEELKIQDINEIKSLAYLKQDENINIIIKANKYNIYSQNAILKILEETPENVRFILITSSKHSMLDTILSRVEIKKETYETKLIDIDFDIEKIDYKVIYNFIKSLDKYSKDELKKLVEAIFFNVKDFKNVDLDMFERAIKLIDLNSDKEAIFSMLLLALKDKNGSL